MGTSDPSEHIPPGVHSFDVERLPRPVRAPRLFVLSAVAPLVLTTVVAGVLAPAARAADVMPAAANTGVPSGVALTRYNGMLTLNVAGKTYSNLDVYGRVRVTAPNVTLQNSIVRGDNGVGSYGLVDANYPNTDHRNFTVRDTTIVPTYPNAYAQAGILGHDFTATRVEITKTTDGVHVTGGNVTVQASWLHDTTFIGAASSPYHADTHNDGVQVIAGSNILISGNTISGNSNAGLMVTQDQGVTSALRFTGNWSSGGACTVNIVAKPRPTISGMTVTNNRFLHDTRNPNCAILQNSGVSMTTSGNVWRDTGAAVVVSRGQ